MLADLPLSTQTEVNDAVASAREAFATWSETPVMERARVLFRFKQKLEEARQEFLDLLEVLGPDDPRTPKYRKELTARLF